MTAMFETLARTGENMVGILFCAEKKGEKTHLPTARYQVQADRNARIMGLSFDGWINRTAPITFAVKFCLKSSKL